MTNYADIALEVCKRTRKGMDSPDLCTPGEGTCDYCTNYAEFIISMFPAPPTKGGQPMVIDDDNDEIIVSLDGRELRGWNYADDAERRQKMLQAREYVEGWCDGRDACVGR